jgi:hypothetical protein
MKRLLIILLLLCSTTVYAEDVVDINDLNTAENLYQKILLLEEKYPKLIDVEVLGYSNDNRPIYVVLMTEDVSINKRVSEGYVEKMHYFVESGIHSRENPGPNIVLKMIEEYAKDYYDDSVVLDYELKSILHDNVIHFIPMTNPDGYNLSYRGLYTIGKSYQDKLLGYIDTDFRNYKSNLNGVDLNRNFPGLFYDIELEAWRNIWNMIHNDFRSFRPSGSFYFGPFEGSEVETQILMDYMLKFDFRNYLSFHSKGQVIYYNKWMLSEVHNERTFSLANKIAYVTGYDLIEGSRYTSSSGYLTDYTAMNTLKPSITVETVYWEETLPVTSKYVKKAYEEVKTVPLLAIKDGQSAGYFDYKWYVDGRYVRDFEESVYARAFYEKYGGQFLHYKGKPKLFLNENMNKLTRLELVEEVMKHFDTIPLGQPYLDCTDSDVLKARNLGIISDAEYFRPDDYATYEETFVVLRQAFFRDYELDYNRILVGRITLGELKGYLLLIEELQGE